MVSVAKQKKHKICKILGAKWFWLSANISIWYALIRIDLENQQYCMNNNHKALYEYIKTNTSWLSTFTSVSLFHQSWFSKLFWSLLEIPDAFFLKIHSFNLFYFLAGPYSMWDLSSLIRDRTHGLCIGNSEC